MTWHDYSLARQYLTEMRVGTRLRQQKRDEDDQAKAAKAAITSRSR
jgi:hypothetical protein